MIIPEAATIEPESFHYWQGKSKRRQERVNLSIFASIMVFAVSCGVLLAAALR